MKRNTVLSWLILLITALVGGCTGSSTLKYKIYKTGDNAETKTISWVKVNSGSFVRIYPGTTNIADAGDISCPLSANKYYTFYFVITKPVSPFDTLDRKVLIDTLRNCTSDLLNIPPGGSVYYRNKPIYDSIVAPSPGTYQQIVSWPPTKSDTTAMPR